MSRTKAIHIGDDVWRLNPTVADEITRLRTELEAAQARWSDMTTAAADAQQENAELQARGGALRGGGGMKGELDAEIQPVHCRTCTCFWAAVYDVARQCSEFYGDEGGTPRCHKDERIAALEADLARVTELWQQTGGRCEDLEADRERLQGIIALCLENLEGIAEGEDIPSTVIMGKARDAAMTKESE